MKGIFEVMPKATGSITVPVRQFPDDAGFDLRVFSEENRDPVVLVHTGIIAHIPRGYVGLVRERSSWAQRGLLISGGVIDAGYEGEIVVVCHNYWPTRARLGPLSERHPRFAQLVIVPLWQDEKPAARRGSRGDGGFGSTGEG